MKMIKSLEKMNRRKKEVTVGAVLCFLLLLFCNFNFVNFKLSKVNLQTNSSKQVQLYPTENEIFDENQNWEQNNERLLKYISKEHLRPPSTQPYDLKNSTGNPGGDKGLAKYILTLLKNPKGGFFVECGAWDGEMLSNTLVLEERDFGWTGLLIEPNENSYASLLTKHRKAWTANICLSLVNRPQLVNFGEVHPGSEKTDWYLPGTSAIQKFLIYNRKATMSVKKCFPIFSVLSALNVTTVDFFSLDIEGSELEVLNTIPFHLILIKIFSIEWNYLPDPNHKAELRRFMESKDYKFIKDHPDLVFVHKTVFS